MCVFTFSGFRGRRIQSSETRIFVYLSFQIGKALNQKRNKKQLFRRYACLARQAPINLKVGISKTHIHGGWWIYSFCCIVLLFNDLQLNRRNSDKNITADAYNIYPFYNFQTLMLYADWFYDNVTRELIKDSIKEGDSIIVKTADLQSYVFSWEPTL